MVSRKTYFGIGFKDPNDPESGPAGKTESEDRSQPTIVDEEKVAEGLRQLRSWYQREDQSDPGATTGSPASPPTSSMGGSQPAAPSSTFGGVQARPTAVGHATAPAASAAQRPLAPDPMRATMYGHDVHQFDLDLPAAGGEATPAASSTALVLADPGSGQHAITRQAGAVPAAMAWPQSDSFNLAPSGEAERLPRPPELRRSSHEIRPQTRVPVMARVMFAVGMAALVAAIAVWLLSGSDSETSSAQRSPAAIPTSPAIPPTAAPEAPAVVPATTATPSERGSAPEAPARPPTKVLPAVPIPNVAAPKIDRPRAPTTPATHRTPRKPREANVDEARSGNGADEKAAGATTPPAERERPSTKPRADTDETLPPSEE